MILRLVFAFVMVLTAVSAYASWPQVQSYRLDVTFEPAESYMTGYAHVRLAQPPAMGDTIKFALHGEVWVDSITISGRTHAFDQQRLYYQSDYSMVGNIVSLAVGDRFDLHDMDIYYSGYFNRSRARSPSDYMRIDETGVYLRSYGYSLWFPVFLDNREQSYPVDFEEVTIRVPAGFTAVFTGEMLDRHGDGEWAVSTWRASGVDLFEAQCTAQQYEMITDGPFRIYHRGSDESQAAGRRILVFAKWLVSRYADRYDHRAVATQYHVMEMPEYGDISSGNVTGVSTQSWQGFNESSYTGATLAHELVHLFVHVSIDQDDPLYAFVIEGFPSWFDSEVMAERLGAEWLRDELAWVEKSYLEKRASGVDRRGRKLPPEKPLDQIAAAEIGTYKDRFVLGERTSLFFNYMAARMGEAKYHAFQRRLFDSDRLTDAAFRTLILEFLPDAREDVRIWLSTTEYPERFRLANL